MRQSILLVEDDPEFATMIVAMLPQCTFKHVRTAKSAQTWLDQGFKTDVVLLDLGLPDSEGIETVVKVAEHAKNIPVIVLTGLDEDRLLTKVRRAGAQDHIDKSQIRGGYWLEKSIYFAMTGKYQAAAWGKDRKTWLGMVEMRATIDDIIKQIMTEALLNDRAYSKLHDIYKVAKQHE